MLLSDALGELVFPEASNPPARLPELSVYEPVALDVARQLLFPKLPVVLRDVRMQRTPVPEASVDEHRNPLRLEDEVRPHDQVGLAFTLCDPRSEGQLYDDMAPPPLDASSSEGSNQR